MELYKEYKLADLEQEIEVTFDDKKLLISSLTHPSFAQENGTLKNNQRLEFLGDSVLAFLINDYLYRNIVDASEGEMSKLKAMIVSTQSLATISKQIGMPKYMLLGRGEIGQRGYDKENILADVFESLLGAIYLDKGIDVTEKFIKKYIISQLDTLITDENIQDYKTKFQEVIQKSGPIKITYEASELPDATFKVSLIVQKIVYGVGIAKSKKKAEQLAAKAALSKMKASSQE